MRNTIWTIKGAFGIIGEIFDELSHADRAWNACVLGESVRETIDRDLNYSEFPTSWGELFDNLE